MSWVFPGQKLLPSTRAPDSTKLCDSGLFINELNSYIHATLFGKLFVISNSVSNSTSYQVSPPGSYSFSHPKVGDVIIGRVTKISQKTVSVSILIRAVSSINAENRPEKYPPGHYGIIRQGDIYDRILDGNIQNLIVSAYRPGDIVRVLVIALAEGNTYYLSSAAPEYGVLYANHSITGERMSPLSDEEMICTSSNQIEPRKVASVSESAQ